MYQDGALTGALLGQTALDEFGGSIPIALPETLLPESPLPETSLPESATPETPPPPG